MRQTTDLEQLALDGHRQGIGWHEFWKDHSKVICQAESYDNKKLNKLVRRLSHLLMCGDLDGQRPPGDPDGLEPWERDDLNDNPNDTITHAHLQLLLPFGNTEART